MDVTHDAQRAIDGVREMLAGVPTEVLAERVVPRRVLGFSRAERIVAVGRVWRLGVLLVGPDAVYATGEVLRVVDPGRRGYTAESARARAVERQAALRGGIAVEETINLDWTPMDLGGLAASGHAGPLEVTSGGIAVRWSRTGGTIPLASYLSERAELLRNPPQGA